VATAHLIHGYLAVGKSTFSQRLAEDQGAVLLSLDAWYLRLFTDGAPTAHQDYVLLQRLWASLDDHWPQILRAGVDVVLDFGFWSRLSRDRARDRALAAGGQARLWSVTCDKEISIQRCLRRNLAPGENFVLDAAAYEALRTRFDALGGDEPCEIIVTGSSTPGMQVVGEE
jgi:predicted kinase